MPYKDPIVRAAKQKERTRKWRALNPERVKELDRLGYDRNREKRCESSRKSRVKNWEKNKDSERLRRRSYLKEKRQEDLNYKLSENLRTRVNMAIKSDQKAGSTINDLGCPIDFLKDHLEAQFQPGMTWENWGRDGWHIDHIIPLSSFDLSDREQFLKAVHYTNLRPLWAVENLKKGDSLKCPNDLLFLIDLGPTGAP